MFHYQADPAPFPGEAIHHHSGSTQAPDRAAMVSERLYQRLVQLLRAQTGELDLMALVDKAIVEVAISQMTRRGIPALAADDHVNAFVQSVRLAGPLPDGPDQRAFAVTSTFHEDDVQFAMPGGGPSGEGGMDGAVTVAADTALVTAEMPAIGADLPASVSEILSGDMTWAEIAGHQPPVMEATLSPMVEGEPALPESHDLMMMIFQDHSAGAAWHPQGGQEFSEEELFDIAA